MAGKLSRRPLFDTRSDVALFVDRERELERVLGATGSGLNAIVFGARGSGKTSFLRRVQYQLRNHGTDVTYIDGALPEDATELLELVRFQIAGAKRPTPSFFPEYAFAEHRPGEPEQLLRTIRLLQRALDAASRRVVLMDNPAPTDAHTLFGRLRDELWRLPLTWVVTADDDWRWQYLRPPADAFFDHVIDLGPLPVTACRTLLERRLGKAPIKKLDVPRLAALAAGNPRELITLARASLEQPEGTDDIEASRQELQRLLAELPRSAAMLVSEMEALGPVSASDERLLRRLGWTRPRAVQVLKQLEEKGIVTSSDETSDSAGRPRKIYSLVGKVLG